MAKREPTWRVAAVSPMKPEMAAAFAALDAFLHDGGETVEPGWLSVDEIAEARGLTPSRISFILRDAVAKGKFEMRKFRIARTSGGPRPVQHYRPKA